MEAPTAIVSTFVILPITSKYIVLRIPTRVRSFGNKKDIVTHVHSHLLRCWCLARRRCTAQQAFHAQTLIHVRPVDSITSAADLPIVPLRYRSVQQLRIPNERHTDCSPVHQSDAQGAVSDLYVVDALIGLRFEEAHYVPRHEVWLLFGYEMARMFVNFRHRPLNRLANTLAYRGIEEGISRTP